MIKYIIGIDEAGRGPLAGPVSLGFFCFRIDIPDINNYKIYKKEISKIFKGVKESKQLSEKKREEWFGKIEGEVNGKKVDTKNGQENTGGDGSRFKFSVSFESAKRIDGRGLSFCIKNAIKKSLGELEVNPTESLVLLDGGLKAPVEYLNQKTIIKGDVKEPVIALASICAKVLRDRKMHKLAKKFPQYGFDVHKGYGTKRHYEAIKKHGVLEEHRKSFINNVHKF